MVVGGDLQIRIVAPVVRIADLIYDRGELHAGLLLGLGAHPVDGIDISPQGRFDIFHHLLHALLAFGWKVTRGVGLAQSFTNLMILRFNTSAPERLDLFCAK